MNKTADGRFRVYLLLGIAAAVVAPFGVIAGLNFYIYGELSFIPIVPTCCAGM